MTAALYEYDTYEDYDINSYVSVRHSRKEYRLTARATEIAGTDKRTYGGRQVATNSQAETSTKKNDELRCSDCKLDKKFDLFPLDRRYPYRHSMLVTVKTKDGKKETLLCGRGYLCKACKRIRYDAAKKAALLLAIEELQQAKVAESKKRGRVQIPKLEKLRAATA